MATFFGPDFDSGFRRVDIAELMDSQAQRLLGTAVTLAHEAGNTTLDVAHLLRATTQHDSTRELLRRAGVDPDTLGDSVQRALPAANSSSAPTSAANNPPTSLTQSAQKVLFDSYQAAQATGASLIAPEHVLLAIAANEDSEAAKLLG